MSVINTNAKEIHFKILYYGPRESGKKSSLLYIKDNIKEDKRNFFIIPFKKEVYSLVLSIGWIFGFQTFFHIYNLNNESKKDNEQLFQGTDGILFVASSEIKARQNNITSFLEMEKLFKERGQDLFKAPLVLQYNKSDLTNRIPLKVLRKDLNKYNNKDFESSVLKEEFVLEPLKYLCKLVLTQLNG